MLIALAPHFCPGLRASCSFREPWPLSGKTVTSPLLFSRRSLPGI